MRRVWRKLVVYFLVAVRRICSVSLVLATVKGRLISDRKGSKLRNEGYLLDNERIWRDRSSQVGARTVTVSRSSHRRLEE